MTWFDSFELRGREKRAGEYVRRLQKEFAEEQEREYEEGKKKWLF